MVDAILIGLNLYICGVHKDLLILLCNTGMSILLIFGHILCTTFDA